MTDLDLLIDAGRRAGAIAVEVNKERSDVAGYFHEHRTGLAGIEVPALVDELLA